jgi:hypothetical protein
MTTPRDQPPHDRPPPLPPQVLPYSPPYVQVPIPAAVSLRRFFLGLGAGVAVSAVVWILGWKPLTGVGGGAGMVVALLLIPGSKLAGGIVCLCLRPWRMMGAGILVSIALGALIFFGVCAMHL